MKQKPNEAKDKPKRNGSALILLILSMGLTMGFTTPVYYRRRCSIGNHSFHIGYKGIIHTQSNGKLRNELAHE